MYVQYDDHAVRRMQQRSISAEQVEQVLDDYVTCYPAEERPNLGYRAMVYVAVVDGRSLKVYVREGSEPPYVLTAAWRDEDH